jgi:hypothetical protein
MSDEIWFLFFIFWSALDIVALVIDIWLRWKHNK